MKQKVYSLFLVICLILTMLPTASASELTADTIGNSSVEWSFDPATGQLTISGSGSCETFASSDDQPWAHLRNEIIEVWFYDMDMLCIEDLAYWFEGCQNLQMAEIPYTTEAVGTNAFADCPALTDIRMYYHDGSVFTFAEGAFHVDALTETMLTIITEQQIATHKIIAYDWAGENRAITARDAYSAMLLASCGLGGCQCTSCDWYYRYIAMNASEHTVQVCCTGCNLALGLGNSAHSFGSDGICSDCGYYNAGYDNSVCYHTSTYYEWSGCTYYEYCNNCGEYLGSGQLHSTYAYGPWEYRNETQHKSFYACVDCGAGTYVYEGHSESISYEQYDSAQHTVKSDCTVCNSSLSSSLADHSDADGNGECDACGYLTSRFSITVPAVLNLAMGRDGSVYAATSAQIVNNSTAAVQVTSVTLQAANGWTLVPYNADMANAKVDSKCISFCLNGVGSDGSAALPIPQNWQIAKGETLPLDYTAKVSAMSQPVDEQVLTITFVISWA